MGRKKRGGKVTGRKGRPPKVVEAIINEETITQSPTESEESCSSGTPKSCNTPIEIEKEKSTCNPATLVQHKKFGKFRCLLLDEAPNKDKTSEISSSEGEQQTDGLEVDPKDIAITTTEDTDIIIEDFKAVDISDTDSKMICEMSVCAEEIIQEEIVEDITDTVIELSSTCDESEQSFLPISELKVEFVNTLHLVSDESQELVPIQEKETDDKIIVEDIKIIDTDTQKILEENKNEESETDSNSNNSHKKDSKASETTTVRRSSRIKSISVLKQRSKGHGLVKMEKKVKPKLIHSDLENLSDSNSNTTSSEKNNSMDSPSFVSPAIGLDAEQKPVKVKSRWRRSSELEMGSSSPITVSHSLASPQIIPELVESTSNGNGNVVSTAAGVVSVAVQKQESPVYDEEMENRLRQFQTLTENQYLTERTSCKEAKKMVCDCFLTKEEIERGEFGCGEDCLNRLLMIECGSQCCVGRRCTNKRFQKSQYAGSEVFRTEKKGFGIRATSDIKYGEFILEYVGEVLDPDEFDKRAKEYSKDKNRHYYFMALRADAVIDATQKGNISRFINHSCDPNAETQKWTVNGELRIGFFSNRSIVAGEEITFDYQFQRYGKEAQKCFCESVNCRGWIGEEPDDDDDDDEEDDDEDDDEVSSDREVQEENDATRASQVENDDVDVKEPKAVVKRQYKKRKSNKKQRKDIFEDLDLDEEIGMLSRTGVKNQVHTLKLSRLMVRAKDVDTRMQLLKLLREGDLPCRRLFLDYHGLRLIYGWMCDASNMTDFENKNYSFNIEILQTLASLPIPNKTMLQDSKVLPTVEKWATHPKTEPNTSSPIHSASNSPQINNPAVTIATADMTVKNDSPKLEQTEVVVESSLVKEEEEDDEPEENKMEMDDFDLDNPPEEIQVEVIKIDVTDIKDVDDDVSTADENKDKPDVIEIKDDETEKLEQLEILKEKIKQEENERIEMQKLEEQRKLAEKEIMEEKRRQEERERLEKIIQKKIENEKLIGELIVKLLSDWAVLKEVFRIPKKERIEQMKEHEREADRDYKAGLNLDQEIHKRDARYSWKNERFKAQEIEKRKAKEELEQQQQQRNLIKKGIRLDDRNIVQIPRLSKHERRQLFALQVAQEEQGRRRKHEQEMWRLHEQRCMVIGADPRLTSIEMAAAGYHYWNPATGQWQNFPPVPPNQQPQPQPPIFDLNLVGQARPQMPPLLMPQMAPNVVNRPPMIQQTYQQHLPPVVKEEVTTFAGPIPPPLKIPAKWKCARDKYGRPYYYHVKIRLPQWEPPEFPSPVVATPVELVEESSSSSESSSVSSDSSTDSDEDSESGDTRLLLEIRNKLKNIEATKASTSAEIMAKEVIKTDSPRIEVPEKIVVESGQKRKRGGLVQEIIISPRREEDKQAHKAELRKYKETKEKLRRQKQALLEQSKKRLKGKLGKVSSKAKRHRSSKKHIKNLSTVDMNSDEAKRIKEIFRSSMASVMVQNLNAFRKPDCKLGRITNTEDFKHLARKLTHFVMLKELKHCQNIEDLTCNDSVKSKARDFVKKYMAKFGEAYSRPKDEMD